jgi:hypothetical protein
MIFQLLGIFLIKFIQQCSGLGKFSNVSDGLTDGVWQLLLSNNPYNRYALNLLVIPF